MAQDYNIYIHGGDGGGDSIASKFIPMEAQDKGSSISDKFMSGFQKAQKTLQMISNAGQTALNAASKAIPWVAVAVAIAKTLDKIATFEFDAIENYGGNYTYSVNYNNFKKGLSYVFNPVNIGTTWFKTMLENQKKNVEIEQQRTLIGSSTLKNRGVGV